MTISTAEAQLELTLLNSKAKDLDRVDILAFFTDAGLPSEIVFRLEELWGATKVIGGKTVQIGKVIISEIIRFIEKNPNLAIGVTIGAAIGALVNLIPFLGPLLAPLAMAVGAIVGGVAGSRLDRGQKSGGHKPLDIAQDVIVLAKKFFELLAAIFQALVAN